MLRVRDWVRVVGNTPLKGYHGQVIATTLAYRRAFYRVSILSKYYWFVEEDLEKI
jgi:hypothetical protein